MADLEKPAYTGSRKGNRRMGPLSVRFKRQVVSVAVLAALIVLYLPFEDESWSIYVAICTAYTILVFGLLWSDGKWRKFIETHQGKPRDLLQRHAIYTLVLILWIWICRFSRPWLPGWMFFQSYRDLTPHLFFSGIGIVAIWWAEQSWLARPPKKDEQIGVSPQ
jgi:hypothetical protein